MLSLSLRLWERVRKLPDDRNGDGGGWVQNTAKVADTAYVGPNAYVLGKAQEMLPDRGVVHEVFRYVDREFVPGAVKVPAVRGHITGAEGA